MKKIIINLVSVLLCLSCNKIITNKTELINIEPSIVIDELSDSTFFRGISYMVYNDYIYATDEQNGRVLKLDTNLKLFGTVGNSGQGPQEFAGIGNLAVWKDTVLALNYGGLALNTYLIDGKFIDRHSLRTDPSLTTNNFCLDNEGFLYFTSVLDSFPIVKYDRKMNRLFGFGEWIEPKNEEFRRFFNNYLICYFDNKILTFQLDAPVVNMYEKDGRHLLKKEFSSQLFEKRLKFKKTEQEKDAANLKKVYMLFYSITSINNKIYLLYIDHDNENYPNCNKVVELLYENNDFVINQAYSLSRLSQDWFVSIVATNDHQIVASNGSMAKLCVYQLN